MAKAQNIPQSVIDTFVANGGTIKKGRTVSVVKSADRKFRRPGASPGAYRIFRLNMLAD